MSFYQIDLVLEIHVHVPNNSAPLLYYYRNILIITFISNHLSAKWLIGKTVDSDFDEILPRNAS